MVFVFCDRDCQTTVKATLSIKKNSLFYMSHAIMPNWVSGGLQLYRIDSEILRKFLVSFNIEPHW